MTQSKEPTNQLDLQEQESQESQESPNPAFNRRQFMGFGAAAAAVLILPKAAQANARTLGRGTLLAKGSTCTSPSLTLPSDTSFVQPKVIASTPTGDYCTLTSNLETVQLPDLTNPSTYVHGIREVGDSSTAFQPGPTLLVNPGDLISLNVTNNLPANTAPPPATGGVESTYCPPNQGKFPIGNTHNTPGCFNSTNLHFHGLHVSPVSVGYNKSDPYKTPVYISSGDPKVTSGDVILTESSDDVLYDLKPEKSNKYCPWLPKFHAPGTHWYHSHHHGSTAIQVGGGTVGALIVKEPAGQEICPGAPDVVMIVEEQAQSLTGNNGYLANLTAQEKLDRGIYERTGNTNTGTFLVNGANNPTLNIQKGEIQRWRMINANSTPRALILLELRAGTAQTGALQTLYRVAIDGITLYGKPVEQLTNSVPFAPGNRFDFLVNLDPGTYTLWKKVDTNLLPNSALAANPQPLATIQVSNTPFDNASQVEKSFNNLITNGIPTTGQPDYLKPITKVNNYNQTPVVFQIPNRAATPPNRVTTAGRGDFQITNTKYDTTNLANIQADLNSTEEWIIANNSGAAHPLHIHVNPFLVVATADISGITINTTDTNQQIYDKLTGDNVEWNSTSNPTVWWDTFAIPNNTAYKIQHRFDDYWGTYVLHCHILIHEDQGMMWNVQVNNVDGKGANPCQQLLTPVVISSSTKY
ncbi:MAG: multicopper oxidase domain-containing protein [Xenococcus sp. MO_188.B8]|nr:multicopper oxidase domain-containing protein [Xenococcus sp. MO_188.B8]